MVAMAEDNIKSIVAVTIIGLLLAWFLGHASKDDRQCYQEYDTVECYDR